MEHLFCKARANVVVVASDTPDSQCPQGGYFPLGTRPNGEYQRRTHRARGCGTNFEPLPVADLNTCRTCYPISLGVPPKVRVRRQTCERTGATQCRSGFLRALPRVVWYELRAAFGWDCLGGLTAQRLTGLRLAVTGPYLKTVVAFELFSEFPQAAPTEKDDAQISRLTTIYQRHGGRDQAGWFAGYLGFLSG
jgi:hypothetical protein